MAPTTLAASAYRQFHAVVVKAGYMQKTVTARIGDQMFSRRLGKKFSKPLRVLVHDPQSSLREGDVISISNGWRVSKQVHHVVNHIIAPFGEPIEARPKVLSLEERLNAERLKRLEKDARRGVRRTWEWEGDVKGWEGRKAEGEVKEVVV